MTKIPERINLANLPTPIDKLARLSAQLGGPTIYVKRDDQTGSELSGNKVRKLEYVIHEALQQGADTLITCGGVQSNHCRATAAAAARLGLKATLVLRGSPAAAVAGNLLLDRLLGADIRWVTEAEYRDHRHDIMDNIKAELSRQGHNAYVIPEGASSGLGAFGYYSALAEIIRQEQEQKVRFDAIVVAVGSGGTYAGLLLARELLQTEHKIIGFNVCNDAAYFRHEVEQILQASSAYLAAPVPFAARNTHIIDGYVGRGYALGRPEERQFIHELAKLEGILLDPVYTGKAFYGLVQEIKKGHCRELNTLLFIHTGGLFGLFPQGHEFELG
ncbi:D-cysteine desulfhydrase family protein [Sporomusa termitida]|uniref:D-cysteine desulfhydrase n=1 Tax=Sporomusa termitida TaxID=2377 RepID=A0A517DNK0_9FIRM|nr:D-cysteine desulfhydrase family protein [Sporomusa termitida]QDR78943.1 D-cysteine desulfhydrase [Sporomusa termitida]